MSVNINVLKDIHRNHKEETDIKLKLRFFGEERNVVFAGRLALQRQRIEKFAWRKNIFAPQLFATMVFSDTRRKPFSALSAGAVSSWCLQRDKLLARFFATGIFQTRETLAELRHEAVA